MSALLPPSQLKSYCHDGRPGRRNYLYLTLVMAMTDFKIKYDNSALGYFWSLLKPLMMFGTLYLVFSVFVRWPQTVPHYQLYLLLGIILWNFLAEVTLTSMLWLEHKAMILKKICFPRWILVISSSLTSLLTLLLNTCVFFVFFLISDAPLGPAQHLSRKRAAALCRRCCSCRGVPYGLTHKTSAKSSALLCLFTYQ